MSAGHRPRRERRKSVASGCLRIAVASMANAIKRISVARGYDVTSYTLQCFGGAGGQHACLVADALGMQRVSTCIRLAGVLSAYGMGLADQIAMRERGAGAPLDAAGLRRRAARRSTLADEAARRAGGPGRGRRRHRAAVHRVHLRYEGTDTALACTLPMARRARARSLRSDFEAAYRQRFAFLMPERALVIEAVSVEAMAAGERAGFACWTPAKPCGTRRSRMPQCRVFCEADEAAGRLARGGAAPCESELRPGARDRRPGDHRRAQRHHRGRAGLAGAR